MSCHNPLKYWLLILPVFFSILGTPDAYGQKETKRKKFYTGVEMGTGLLMLSQNKLEAARTARYVLGFYGGYTPIRALRLGINLNGYLIESFGNFYTSPEKGISISNTQAQLQIVPFRGIDLFANFQGGWSVYTNHHPGSYNSKGMAGKAGLGYGFNFGKRIAVSLIFNYGAGKFKDVRYPGISVTDQHYNSFDILVSLTYR